MLYPLLNISGNNAASAPISFALRQNEIPLSRVRSSVSCAAICNKASFTIILLLLRLQFDVLIIAPVPNRLKLIS